MLITSDNFKNINLSECSLSIIVFESEIVCIVNNKQIGKIEAFDKVGNINDISLLKNDFKEIKVIVVNEQFTLIPEAIYDEDNTDAYINFSTESINIAETIVSKNQQFSLNTVWRLDKELKDKITTYWPGAFFTHYISHRLTSVAESGNKNDLIVDFLPNCTSIIFFKKEELQLANYFSTNGDEDALYYLLLTLEQSEINVDEINVAVNGNSSIVEKVKKYFKNITTDKNKYELPITEEDAACITIL